MFAQVQNIFIVKSYFRIGWQVKNEYSINACRKEFRKDFQIWWSITTHLLQKFHESIEKMGGVKHRPKREDLVIIDAVRGLIQKYLVDFLDVNVVELLFYWEYASM